MSHINSPVRISIRRASALLRRQENLKDWQTHGKLPAHKAPLTGENLAKKIATCETDITNLHSKGVK